MNVSAINASASARLAAAACSCPVGATPVATTPLYEGPHHSGYHRFVTPANSEARAREDIDRLLAQAGWHVCDYKAADIHAAMGVAIREFEPHEDASSSGCATSFGAEDDRLIGALWANLSEGRCRFVMVKDRRWEWIEKLLT